jgi:regulator of sigma E protease
MITLFLFIAILGILIIVHEFGHFIAAKRSGVKVEQFCVGFGPVLFKKRKGETEYSVAAIPLGGFVKLAGDNLGEFKGGREEFLSQPPAKRFKIVFFGPLLNYVLGFAIFWLIFFIGYPTLSTKVGELLEGYGAKEAGLLPGDRITAVDGKKITLWEDLQKAVFDKKAAESMRVSFLRNNMPYELEVPLKKKEVDNVLGEKRSVGLLGIAPAMDELVTVRHGIFASALLSLRKTWDLTELTYKGLWRMLTGRLSVKESVTGPLGIFFITSKAAHMGAIAVLHLIAVLSISLALFNVLPLPVLDGGHIFFLALEKIRGRMLSAKAEKVITQVGITMLLSFALFITYNDFLRFFGDRLSAFFK